MMREVPCDDGNGESTFEFVESKIEGLNLNDETGFKPKTTESHTENESEVTIQGISTSTTSTLSTNIGTHPSHAFTETTSSFPSPLSSTIPPVMQTVHPPGSVPFPSAPPQFQQTSSPFYGNNSLMSPIDSYSFATQGTPEKPLIVQSQPSTLYPMSPSVATAINLPISDPSSHAQFSPSDGPENRGGFFGWIKDTMSGSEFLNKVAEKAKNSMDSMITTLDPQMKEYIYSGGDISIILTSDEESVLSGVREAFQSVFGRASVHGVAVQANVAEQPVGFTAALKCAEERINVLRQAKLISEMQPVLAIEHFLVEIISERWYDVGCLVLQDPGRHISLHCYTQATPVPIQAVQQAQDETPATYPLRWSGLGISISKIISHMYQIPQMEWHKRLSGVSKRDMVYQTAKAIATNYKYSIEKVL